MVANWVMGDVLNEDMMEERWFSHVRDSDAPAPSSNRYQLQLPMTTSGFLDESIYSQLEMAMATR